MGSRFIAFLACGLLACALQADPLDELIGAARRGVAPSDLAQVRATIKSVLADHGRAYDRAVAQLYLSEVKASIIDPENHGGWPYRSFLVMDKGSLSEDLLTELKREYAENPNPVLAYALICPALYASDETLVGQLEAYLKLTDPYLYKMEQGHVNQYWRPWVKRQAQP